MAEVLDTLLLRLQREREEGVTALARLGQGLRQLNAQVRMQAS